MNLKYYFIIIAILLVIKVDMHVYAGQEEVDSKTIFELDKMMVRAQRNSIIPTEILDSTVISQPLDSKTADGLLANLAGIDVQRTSPAAGKGTGVSIRGLDESRSLILLNGRPLNGAGVMGGEYVDWTLLPTTDIAEIEVIRGVKSAEYGNTVGGVINIITRRNMQKPGNTKVNASYGIVSPEHARDALDNRSTDVSIVHHANIVNTAALDIFAGHSRGEPFLRNNYYERTNFGGEFSVMLPWDVRASAGFLNTFHTRGFAIANVKGSGNYDPDYPESGESAGGGPGIQWNTSVDPDLYFGDRSYWKNNRTQIDFSLQKDFPKLLLTALAHINDQDRTEYFYAKTDTTKLVLERFAKPEDHTWGWNIIAKQDLGDKHSLKYGLEGNVLQYSSSDIRTKDPTYFRVQPSDGDPDSTVRAASRYGVFVQSSFAFAERFSFTPGIRYDFFNAPKRNGTDDELNFNGVSPNAGLSVKTWKGGEVSLQGAYAHRYPTCPELYWFYSGFQLADRRDLTPEKAAQAELGLSQAAVFGEKLLGKATVRGYYYNVTDYIRTIFGYQPSRLIYNIDQVDLAGVECELSIDLLKSLNFRGNYTLQKTEKSGDTKDSSMVLTKGLPELPKNKGFVALEYRPSNGATVGFSMRFVGEREVITGSLSQGGRSSLEHIDAFVTGRLYGSYPIVTNEAWSAKIKLGIDNLFNAEYEEQSGLPMPGFTATGAVEVTF